MRDQILNKFVDKMKDSGYNTDTRRQVIKRGIIRYETLRDLDKAGARRLHRPARSTQELRMNKKITNKVDWYKTSNKPVDKKEEIVKIWAGSHIIRRKGNGRQTIPAGTDR